MNLLNSTLPECDLDNIKAILAANNMPVPVPETGGYSFNCWGFVALTFGWEVRPLWLSAETMEYHLRYKTDPIKEDEACFGDIAVFRGYMGRLTHTALVLQDKNIVCQKSGSAPLNIATLDQAKQVYTNNVTFVRPKKVEKKSLTAETKWNRVLTL